MLLLRILKKVLKVTLLFWSYHIIVLSISLVGIVHTTEFVFTINSITWVCYYIFSISYIQYESIMPKA